MTLLWQHGGWIVVNPRVDYGWIAQYANRLHPKVAVLVRQRNFRRILPFRAEVRRAKSWATRAQISRHSGTLSGREMTKSRCRIRFRLELGCWEKTVKVSCPLRFKYRGVLSFLREYAESGAFQIGSHCAREPRVGRCTPCWRNCWRSRWMVLLLTCSAAASCSIVGTALWACASATNRKRRW